MAEQTTEESYSTGNRFSNPPSASAGDTQHGYSKDRETMSGHVFRVNDSWGEEQIHREHCSGSRDTYKPGGDRDVHIVGEDYEFILKDKTLTVNGDLNIVVNGNCNLTVGNPVTNQYFGGPQAPPVLSIVANGNVEELVYGKKTTRITGNYFLEVDGDFNVNAGENHIFRCQNYDKKVEGGYRLEAGAKAKLEPGSEAGNSSVTWHGLKNTTFYDNALGSAVTFSQGELTTQAKNIDMRGGDPTYVSPNGQPGGVNLSSGGDFTIAAGLGRAINLENGDINMTLGNLNLELGNIQTGFGSISTLTGAISTVTGSVSSTLGSVTGVTVDAEAGMSIGGSAVAPGPHTSSD